MFWWGNTRVLQHTDLLLVSVNSLYLILEFISNLCQLLLKLLVQGLVVYQLVYQLIVSLFIDAWLAFGLLELLYLASQELVGCFVVFSLECLPLGLLELLGQLLDLDRFLEFEGS